MLKTYNQSSIEQLCVCTVRLRDKDKIAKYRLFVVTEDDPVLLGMPDTELLDIIKITCEVMGDPHKSRMFNSQTIQTANSPTC